MELSELLTQFLAWAWDRHHNPLSWFIRPFFLIPFCYFAYRRSWPGILATLAALASSMFWFPRPAAPPAWVIDFLAAEKAYLLSAWTPAKLGLTLLVPLSLGALAAAFWVRSIAWGVAVIVLIALAKSAWSIYEGGQAGWSVLPFALIGLLVCAGVIALTHRRWAKPKAAVKP